MASLHLFIGCAGHTVIAKVVETKLGICTIGNVSGILGAANLGVLLVLDTTHGEAEEFEKGTHPFGVPSREVVVDRHNVDAKAGKAVEEDRKGSYGVFPPVCISEIIPR